MRSCFEKANQYPGASIVNRLKTHISCIPFPLPKKEQIDRVSIYISSTIYNICIYAKNHIFYNELYIYRVNPRDLYIPVTQRKYRQKRHVWSCLFCSEHFLCSVCTQIAQCNLYGVKNAKMQVSMMQIQRIGFPTFFFGFWLRPKIFWFPTPPGRPSWKATGLLLQPGGPVGRRQGYNCNLGTRDFLWQAQLEGDRATTAIWELEIFWWQAQLKGERATTAIWELEIFWWQAQLEGDRATTAIWELEIFWWQAQLEGDRATTAIWELEIFWGQAQLEGDRATTAIWELEIFRWQAGRKDERATTAIWELEIFGGRLSSKATGLQLQSGNSRFFSGRPSWKATGLQLQSGNSRFLGGRPSWKATGLQLQSGNSRFFGGRSCCNATGLLLQSGNSKFFGWQAQLENGRATLVASC